MVKAKDDDDVVAYPSPDRVLKITVPLSSGVEVMIHIFGGDPTHEQFEQLKLHIDLIDASINGKVPAPVVVKRERRRRRRVVNGTPQIEVITPVVPVKVKKKYARRRVLGPCPKHPDSPRSDKTNRCLACQAEHLTRLHRRNSERMLKKNQGLIQ